MYFTKDISQNIFDPERIPHADFSFAEFKKRNLVYIISDSDYETDCLHVLEQFFNLFEPESDLALIVYFLDQNISLDPLLGVFEKLNPNDEPTPELIIFQDALSEEVFPALFSHCQGQIILSKKTELTKGLSLRGLLMNQHVYLPAESVWQSGELLRDLFWIDNGKEETSLSSFMRSFYSDESSYFVTRNKLLSYGERVPEISNVPANHSVEFDSFIARFGYQEQRSRNALILTMPRSGTWYHRYFIAFYNLMCQGFSAEEIISRILDKSFIPSDPIIKSAFGPELFSVNHSICPGFRWAVSEAELEQWEQLKFYSNGFIEGLNFTQSSLFDPEHNPDVRIVYVYRNPLDQAVSVFNHIRKHKDHSQRFYQNKSGQKIELTSVSQYFREVGLETYLKQFLTFSWGVKKFPQQIKMLTYERLTADPSAHFQNVLEFMGDLSICDTHLEVFKNALKYSDKDAMKALENKIGSSLGSDQADSKERHIRSGAIGQWQKHLNDEALEFAEALLKRHSLSLSQFITLPEQLC